MATQSYIIQSEEKLIDGSATGEDCAQIRHAYEHECACMGNDRPFPENYDVWGTLWLNALSLNRKVTSNGACRVELARLIEAMNPVYA